MVGRVSEVVRIMGGERVLGRRVRAPDELRRAVEAGLPVAALGEVVRHVGEPSLKYRLVPKATLARRKQRLSPAESERLERLARLMALAEHVWENDDHARQFMLGHQARLGGERPVDLARSDLGGREVEELLMELEYSFPA